MDMTIPVIYKLFAFIFRYFF